MSNNTFISQGTIERIGETRQVTERFKVRPIVVTLDEDSERPQSVQFQVTGRDCERLNTFEVGQEITFEFTLRGREHGGRHYIDVNITQFKLTNA